MRLTPLVPLLVVLAWPACCAQAPVEVPSLTRAWDTLAKRYVDAHGLVDYAGLRADAEFDRLIRALATFDPTSLPDDDARLAFWINAYNALTIHGVLERLPADRTRWASWKPTSIEIDGKSFWKGMKFRVAKRSLTLDEIEHEVIRGDPRYRDPRIHVALVCAARGCPPLLNRAYRGAKLDEQLHDRMKKEIANSKRTRWDAENRRVEVSRIFDWYGKDFVDPKFTPHAKNLGAFLGRYVADPATAAALTDGTWTIGFHEYDWRLNLQPSR